MKLPVLLAALCAAAALPAAEPLRLSGSTTAKGALEPQRAALEAAVGRPLEFAGPGTSAGLLSLANGSADVGMLSLPLEEVARLINEKTPGRIDPAAFRAVHIGDVRNVFVVNPRNKVRALSALQLAAILAGEIGDWSEVGGAPEPIVVVSLMQGGNLLQDQLLRGKPITAKARLVPNATQIAVVVAQEPNAIGVISTAHARGQTSLVQTDANVFAHLFLVTKGEPTPEAAKLAEAAKVLLSHL